MKTFVAQQQRKKHQDEASTRLNGGGYHPLAFPHDVRLKVLFGFVTKLRFSFPPIIINWN